MRLKEIRIQPSNWMLDVYLYTDIEEFDNPELHEHFSKRYGASADYYREWLTDGTGPGSFVTNIGSTNESELNGHNRIVMTYSGEDNVLVHELLHVLWRYAKLSGCEMNYDTQEWQAILFEYLYDQVKNSKGFMKIF